ncbi:putative nucleolar complex-associated protein [Helianthus annuus]|nr:putative nucleolar complex-associated protein [Helianthus annuus]KAJ0552678.1 putative nucleolar complex-associated protein [Helianthus annuus]KAJ0721607.1 putative nucleolar complex-associated protein [Helianthus annuus]
MLENPEGNIKHLKEMLQICKNGDRYMLDLGLKSILAVFKDTLPGYIILIFTHVNTIFIHLCYLTVYCLSLREQHHDI